VVDGLVLMVTTGVLYAIFIALGGNHILARRFSNPAIVKTLVYLVPLPIVMLPAGLLASVMVVQDKVNKLTIYNVLSSLVLTVGVITGCLLWKTPEAMILVRVGITLLTGMVAIALIVRTLPRDDWRPRLRNMKNMVTFSIPLVLAGALGTISLQLDKIIVSSMCSPEDFAVYSTGALEIPIIGMITGSIASVILPDLRRMISASDHAGALALFRKSAEKSAVLLIPIMMFLLVSAEPFILTLFSSKYVGSVLPFRLYLLELPVRIVMFGSFMTALGQTRIILYRSIAGLAANLVLSIILVKLFGYTGAIVATVLTLYLVACVWNFTAISHAVSCRWWEVVPFDSLFRILAVSAAACLPVLGLRLVRMRASPVIQLGCDAACFAATFAFLLFTLRVQPLLGEAQQGWRRIAGRMGLSARFVPSGSRVGDQM